MKKSYFISSTLLFLFYFIFVTSSFFVAPYVSSINENEIITGYVYSLSIAIAIILMLITSFLNDKKIISSKFMLITYFIIGMLSFISLYYTNGIYLYIAFIINSSVLLSLPAFLDSYVLDYEEESNYSIIRAFGSFGAAISYFVSSSFLESNFSIVIIVDVILFILMILIVSLNKTTFVDTKVHYSKAIKSVLSNKNLLLMFVIAFLTYGVLRADDPFTYNYNIEYVGLSATFIGLIGLISIIFEGSVFILYRFLSKIFNMKALLYIAIINLFFIFLTKYYLYNVPLVINIGNIMLGLFVGLFVPVMIHTIVKYGNKDTKTSLLSTYQIFVYIGGAILGFITTYIYDMTDFLPDIYLLHTAIILLSLVFVFSLKKID